MFSTLPKPNFNSSYTFILSSANALNLQTFENIVGKGKNAGNQHFLLYPQCFLLFLNQISIVQITFILSSANALNLDQSKILMFGKELRQECYFQNATYQ